MAEFGTVSIGFAIKISAVVEVRAAPTRYPFVNRFDYHGDALSLDRLPLESNIDFKKRMMDLFVNGGGPTYEGFLNNLSRELASPRFLAITIDLKTGSDGQPIAYNPRVDILVDKVVLYNNWSSYTSYEVDREIAIYSAGDEGYFLGDLVSAINESPYFVAYIDPDARRNLHSSSLIRGTTYNKTTNDILRNDQLTILRMRNIVRGSVWFGDKKTFRTEVLSDPQASGEYKIDYTQGLVYSYDVPATENSCGYDYALFPFKVYASLIQLYSLQDPSYVKKLFHQETLPSDEETNALPNTEGAEVIHQLFKECNVFWGE